MILRRWATVCAVAALVTTGAAVPASAAAPAATFAPTPCWTPNLPGFPTLDLTPDFTCGYLTVPENRTVRNGRTIEVGVARVPAVHPRPGADPLVYLTGGPGGTSIVLATRYVADGFNRDRDVIFVDQRAEFHADPLLNCPEIDDFVLAQVGLPIQAASTKRKDLAATVACRNRLAADGVDLSAYNTTENAADIADLRVALRIPRWNVYGVSYGSDLALQLLRDHPQGIRSVVVDSLVPPQITVADQFWPSAAEGFKALFAACAGQPACKRAYPDLAEEFYATVNRLARQALTVPLPSGPVVIDGYTLANLVTVLSLQPGTYAGMPKLIHDIAHGDGTAAATALLTTAGGGPSLTAYGLAFGVFCSEHVPFTTPARSLAVARRALPQFPDSVLSLVPQSPRLVGECGVWNVPKASPSVHRPTRSDVPVLLMAGALDAVTPPSQAYLAARTLSRSRVVVFPGIGHDAAAASDCAMTVMLGFLDNPGRYDTSCVARMKDPAFVT